jgi:hypothetical protein
MSPVFTIRYVFISAAVALLAVVSISAMPQTPARQTFLAIVRADGGLVPIAIHDGREWWNRWPWAIEGDPEVTALPVPARLDAIPPEWLPPGVRLPATWRWQPKDRPARAIRVLHPFRTTASDLMSTILLRTDLPGPSADREERNAFEPLGVAIAGRGELGRLVQTPASMSSRILRSLGARLETLERDALATWRKERRQNAPNEEVSPTRTFRHPDEERQSPFRLTTTERPVNGRHHHYLDGTKLYKLGLERDPECKVNVAFEGVVVTRPDGRVISETVSVSPYEGYCGDAASWLEPLASLRFGTRLLWICRYGVEDGYDYLLFDPVANEAVDAKGQWGMR